MKKKLKLTERLALFLTMGCKSAGSYDPNEALSSVEEQMTGEEYQIAQAFLKWLTENKRTFGHNLPLVWAEYQAAQ